MYIYLSLSLYIYILYIYILYIYIYIYTHSLKRTSPPLSQRGLGQGPGKADRHSAETLRLSTY